MTRTLCFIFLVWHPCVQAQHLSDTSFLNAAIKNTVGLYETAIRGQTSLYNGSQYKQAIGSYPDHPFFESEDWVYGNVTYDKQLYDNVPLVYDITRDQLITENVYNGSELVLVDEKLDRFKIGIHDFVKLDHKTLPKPGFYELLYNGPSKVVAKRQKVMRETISMQAIEVNFDVKDRYYIHKNGAYFQVRSKGSVLKLFKDKRPELKDIIKKYKIQFKTNYETALTLTAGHYDALNDLR